MPAYSLAEAQTNLAAVNDAITAVLTGQEYKIGARSLRRADLAALQTEREYWVQQVSRLERGGITIYGGTPCN